MYEGVPGISALEAGSRQVDEFIPAKADILEYNVSVSSIRVDVYKEHG